MTPHPLLRSDLALRAGYHSPQVPVAVRLNTNESPYPPPAAYLEALAAAVAEVEFHRYPDRSAEELRRRVGQLHGVGPEQILCANGSNEVLQALLLAFAGPGATVVVAEPTYALHSHIAQVVGCSVAVVDRRADFTVDPDALIATARSTGASVVFCCSPNNPTGTLEAPATIAALLEGTEGLVVVDEAYGQFAPSSALELDLEPSQRQRLVVVRTFSKTWAMAGVRLGYLVGDPALVLGAAEALLPYHLSALTQLAGTLALDFTADMERRVEAIVEGRSQVVEGLRHLDVDQFDSAANFILLRPRRQAADAVWQGLVDRGVLVRNCASWPGLENCLRVTIGTPSENALFLSALEEVLR